MAIFAMLLSAAACAYWTTGAALALTRGNAAIGAAISLWCRCGAEAAMNAGAALLGPGAQIDLFGFKAPGLEGSFGQQCVFYALAHILALAVRTTLWAKAVRA